MYGIRMPRRPVRSGRCADLSQKRDHLFPLDLVVVNRLGQAAWREVVRIVPGAWVGAVLDQQPCQGSLPACRGDMQRSHTPHAIRAATERAVGPWIDIRAVG